MNLKSFQDMFKSFSCINSLELWHIVPQVKCSRLKRAVPIKVAILEWEGLKACHRICAIEETIYNDRGAFDQRYLKYMHANVGCANQETNRDTMIQGLQTYTSATKFAFITNITDMSYNLCIIQQMFPLLKPTPFTMPELLDILFVEKVLINIR